MFADSNLVVCIVDILKAEHLFSVTQPLQSDGSHFLSVHNYRPLFYFPLDWIYWIYMTPQKPNPATAI